jgi:hypothetical protein
VSSGKKMPYSTGHCSRFQSSAITLVFGSITDDVLWRATRRAGRTWNKNKLTTRRGPVHSNGGLCHLSGLPRERRHWQGLIV